MTHERQDAQGMAMGQKTTQDVEPETKKLDLSVAQVAGTSLATVAAAVLASQLGVYGTIGGAAVVSVVATAGGPVIQHFFRRTGDQLRGAVRPGSRRTSLRAEEELPDGTILLRAVPADPAPGGEFGSATVHGTRVRGWKRTAVAAGAAFAIAVGGLGTYEAIAGTSVSSDGRTLLTGGAGTARDHDKGGTERAPGSGGSERKGGKTPESGGPSPRPSDSPGGTGGRSASPEPDRSASGVPSPPPVTPTPAPPATPSAPVTPDSRPPHSTAPSDPAPQAPPAGGGSGRSSGT
ncbi:hypothetical protein ACFWUW_03045 [Streptomyces sp. NPDC058655]|uniref:hypothetical protein n=1 Tax=Streptomyces sp. NPDC058655 TaxID=3346577 RepID=UPI003665BCF4